MIVNHARDPQAICLIAHPVKVHAFCFHRAGGRNSLTILQVVQVEST